MLTLIRDWLRITSTCLAWSGSYFVNQNQRIQMHGRMPTDRTVVFGVPHGSVLGPLMFLCYAAPLGDIARRHGINVHLYADVTQLYLAFSPHSDEDTSKQSRASKIVSPHIKIKLSMPHIELGDTVVPVSTVAKNIGVFFDDALSMNNQVQHICRVGYFHIRCIEKIRNILDRKTSSIMIIFYVTSRLDNGHCLLYGISDHLLI